MRSLVRGAAEVLATGSGLAALARHRGVGSTAILAYHNVVAPEDAGRGDSSLHLPLPRFVAQIERLVETHEVVRLEDLVGTDDFAGDEELAAVRQIRGRPRAVITFDDAYRGAVTLALPELVRRGLPAAVFVAPGLLGTPGTWWDELAEAGLLSEDAREAALVELGGRGDAVRERILKNAAPDLPDSYGIATPEELREHCVVGITLGSHTWNHEYLPAISAGDVRASLQRTMDWLIEFSIGGGSNDAGESAADRPWLALPYGGGSVETGTAALDMGHAGVLRIEGGCCTAETNRAWAPRINVPAGMSRRGFELRVSGVFPR